MWYLMRLRHNKDLERSLEMVTMLIELPPREQENDSRDSREEIKENISKAEGVFKILSGIFSPKKRGLYMVEHFGFEIISYQKRIYFYAISPKKYASSIENAIVANYHNVQVRTVENYNIFSPEENVDGIAGGVMDLDKESYYPINSYKNLDSDLLTGILSSISKLEDDQAAGIQFLFRPVDKSWYKSAQASAKSYAKGEGGHSHGMSHELTRHLSGYGKIFEAPFKVPSESERGHEKSEKKEATQLDQNKSQQISEKSEQANFETEIRIIAIGKDHYIAKSIANNIATNFAQVNNLSSNKLKYHEDHHSKNLARDFIFKIFPIINKKNVLSVQELATLWHLPSQKSQLAAHLERRATREVSAPSEMPTGGLILGSNIYRGRDQVMYLTDKDRARHLYIIGQTGTGKSSILENLILQDIAQGKGVAFIDPHGDSAELIMGCIPPWRANDVIYFSPGDTEYPMGFNILEYSKDEQKDFIIQETIQMLYKLYDPTHQGIIGPRFEHWYRNSCLTLMADKDSPATFLEVPKPFIDDDYLKAKFKYVNDATVKDFWINEMGQTSDYHKSEILGWFVSKFGAFASNSIMRNVMGQQRSSFDFRDVMDNGKILLVNLSKGLVGDLNANLLGIILVIKFQMAAMSRADTPEHLRRNFTLYVDEFQNFATDSFAVILSEARKYRLELIVANQFIGQLDEKVRDAVFGNVGSVISYRVGEDDAEYLAKKFAPTFNQTDLANIPNFSTVAKIMANNLPTTPFTMKMVPKLSESGIYSQKLHDSIKELSRIRFSQPKTVVEADIMKRLANKLKQPLKKGR